MNTSSVDKALLVIQANQGQLPLLGGDSAYRPQLLQSGGKNAVWPIPIVLLYKKQPSFGKPAM